MKRNTTRYFVGAAAAALLAVGAPTPAFAADVTNGHVDIVEIECTNGVYEVGSHIEDTHVEPADIGNYNFVFDNSASTSVSYNATADTYTVAAEDETTIPSLGFIYEAIGTNCASSLTVAWDTASGPGDVLFNGKTSVSLPQGQHVHGTWTYTGATSGSTAYNYTVDFSVPSKGLAVDGVKLRVQP